MAGALTTYAEAQALKFLIAADNDGSGVGHQQGTAAVKPVLPLMVRLCTTLGNDDTPGVEVVKGTSDYEEQPVTFTELQSDNTVLNENIVRFNNMPDVPYVDGATEGPNGGVRAFEIWDSAETPIRWWYAPLTTFRGYAAGDAAEFPVHELILAID